jgi:uncharacterized YccA/Bax inhibitor family protein
MQSSNPVFSRSEGFNGRGSTQTYAGNGMSYPAYGSPQTDPSARGAGTTQTPVDQGRMTIDSVVQKTGITLALVVLSAAATWYLTGDPANEDDARTLMTLWMGGAFAGLGLALVLSFKKSISPGLVLAYAVVEGVFIGAMSKYFEAVFGDGIVVGAVL